MTDTEEMLKAAAIKQREAVITILDSIDKTEDLSIIFGAISNARAELSRHGRGSQFYILKDCDGFIP